MASSRELMRLAMAKLVQNICQIWLYHLYQADYSLQAMKTRREFCQVCLANAILGSPPLAGAWSDSDTRIVYRQDLPAVNLSSWQVTFLELNFLAGLVAPSHRHAGFVLGYVLERKYRFHVELAGDYSIGWRCLL